MLRGMRSKPERQLEVLRQMLVDLPLPSDPSLIEEIGRVFGVEGVGELQGAEPPFAASSAEAAGSVWKVGWTSIDADGLCLLSRKHLQALQISPEEEKVLLDCISRLANDNGYNKGFRRFQTWVGEQEPYDIVIDGANVGFTSQNKDGGQFQYHQIDAVARHYHAQGKRILLVLHPKWLKADVCLSTYKRKKRKLDQISSQDAPPCPNDEEEENGSDVLYPHEGVTQAEEEAPPGSPLHVIRTWKEMGILACVPFYDCDDWYWLYAALNSFTRGHTHVQVISNDNLRDHHWRMHGLRTFLQWQDRHMTRLSMSQEEDEEGGSPDKAKFVPELHEPVPYSRRAQVSVDRTAWHFLVPAVRTRAEQLQSGRPVGPKEVELAEKRWMVAWRES